MSTFPLRVFPFGLMLGTSFALGALLAPYLHRRSPSGDVADAALATPRVHRRAEQVVVGIVPARTGRVPSGADHDARRAAVVAELTQLCRGGLSDISSVLALCAWTKSADQADLIAALSSVHEVAPDREFAGMIQDIVMARFGELDGEVGLALLNAPPDGQSVRGSARTMLFKAWVKTNPRAALDGAFAELGRGVEGMGSLVAQMLDAFSGEYPALANERASLLARSDDEKLRQIGFEARAGIMHRQLRSTHDCRATAAWIDATQVSPDERLYLYAQLIDGAIDRDDAAGAVHAFRQLGVYTEAMLAGNVVGALAKVEPEQAKQMALSFSPGEVRASAIQELSSELARSASPSAALSWLQGQGTHADFDGAYQGLAKAFSETDLPNAWRSVAQMTDSAESKRMLGYQYGFDWLKSDFASASRELPEPIVSRYARTQALLRELREVFPDSPGDFSINWEEKKGG